MSEFTHERHKPVTQLSIPRELVVVCAPLRSNVNVSRIVRASGCAGVTRVICCGSAKVLTHIARDGADTVTLEVHRTLLPVLLNLRGAGYRLVGLEQTTGSKCIYEFAFPRRTALIVGNERVGLEQEILAALDEVVEIPVYGLPYSHNVAAATTIALYEYCRQFPAG